jgi:hypothetical protein
MPMRLAALAAADVYFMGTLHSELRFTYAHTYTRRGYVG